MTKYLSIISFFALIFTACEKSEEAANKSAIKLITESEINVGPGSAMGFIKYELITPVDGASVEATANVDWIGNFGYKEMGKITYTVEQNPNETSRTGVITVTYNDSSFDVTIYQAENPAPTNKTITDFQLTGKYYGIQSGLYNYYLIFNDRGLDSGNMYNVPDARFYFVDLYLDKTPEDINNITIPLGTYEFDKSNSGFAGTFTDSFSWYQQNDANGMPIVGNQIHYDKGKLTVEEGKITLEVSLMINDIPENHTIMYEGDYSLINEESLS